MSFYPSDTQRKQANQPTSSPHTPCPKATSTALSNTLWHSTRSLLLLSSAVVLFCFFAFSLTLLRLF